MSLFKEEDIYHCCLIFVIVSLEKIGIGKIVIKTIYLVIST